LAGSVFARPDITPVITSFNGNAKLEWVADLDANGGDGGFGFANSTWTELKIQTRSADWGGESNSGDGLWGELQLNTGGDFVTEKHQDDDFDFNIYNWSGFGWRKALVVGTAKIHFVDGDTYFNMDILKPDFGVGEIGYVRATKVKADGTLNWDNWEDVKFAKVGGYAAYQGFTLNFGVPIVDLAFAFGDNGSKTFKDGKYAFKFAGTLKPIDGLKIYAGIASNTEDFAANLAAAVTVGYNYKIDDQFYIKPAVQFDMFGKAMNIGAAVLFGWGSEGQTWNHDFLTFSNKTISFAENGTRAADGLSVMFVKGIKDKDGNDVKASTLNIEFYDNKLLNGLDIGTFTYGAAYRASGEDLGKGAVSAAFIYNNNFDIVYLTARLSFGMDLAASGDNNGVKYGLRVGTKELIANTDVYFDYVGCVSKYAPDANAKDGFNKGTAKIGCQINF
jgi:hypothetical protein